MARGVGLRPREGEEVSQTLEFRGGEVTGALGKAGEGEKRKAELTEGVL